MRILLLNIQDEADQISILFTSQGNYFVSYHKSTAWCHHFKLSVVIKSLEQFRMISLYIILKKGHKKDKKLC